MKILFFNWVDYFNNPSRGGGVTVYQRNLIEQLRTRHQLFFVSGGEAYNPFTSKVYWCKKKSDRDVSIFEIVNSEVIAPGHLAWNDPATIRSERTQRVWEDLLRHIQPDVIHFNNLEGLPVTALDIKSILPDCKVIFSLHNYYPFCPTVKLWRGCNVSCQNYDNGRACVGCQPEINRRRELLVKSLKWIYHLCQREVPAACYRWIFSDRLFARFICSLLAWHHRWISQRLLPNTENDLAEYFNIRRKTMVSAINLHCDVVLAVSCRVKELAEIFGVNSEILHVDYIGTRVAENIIKPKKPDVHKLLTLIYPGYMTYEKGFFFMLDVLESLPDDTASKINLIIAARNTNIAAWSRMMALSERFNSFDYYDGYTHDQLGELYSVADLTLTPVLWEDNLPQVAIESVCYGVPVLCSQMGGAQELSKNNSELLFPAGDVAACCQRLIRVVDDRSPLVKYWFDICYPPTMRQHVNALEVYYAGSRKSR